MQVSKKLAILKLHVYWELNTFFCYLTCGEKSNDWAGKKKLLMMVMKFKCERT